MTGGLLEIEIAGFGAGQFDILNTLGTGSITGGTILFFFLDDFLPKATDPVLDFLFAEDLTIGPDGEFPFQGVDESFELSVAMLDGAIGGKFLRFDALNDALPLTPNAVPVPAAAWLFGTALIGLAGLSKRRKTAWHSTEFTPRPRHSEGFFMSADYSSRSKFATHYYAAGVRCGRSHLGRWRRGFEGLFSPKTTLRFASWEAENRA